MKPLPQTPELLALAKTAVWFKAPPQTLADPPHFIAHVLTYGTHADVKVLRRYVDDAELRTAIEQAPPGIFNARSWTYWNLKIGRYPAPPMPQRRFE